MTASKDVKKVKLAAGGCCWECSDIGHEDILNLDECKDAAKSIERSFSGSKSLPNWPKGCVTYRTKIYYNSPYKAIKAKHDRRKDAYPVCHEKTGKLFY